MKREICSRIVPEAYNFRGRSCKLPVVITIGGKHYCRIHNPNSVAQREKQRSADFRRKLEEDAAHHDRKWKLNAALLDLLDACEEFADEMSMRDDISDPSDARPSIQKVLLRTQRAAELRKN